MFFEVNMASKVCSIHKVALYTQGSKTMIKSLELLFAIPYSTVYTHKYDRKPSHLDAYTKFFFILKHKKINFYIEKKSTFFAAIN